MKIAENFDQFVERVSEAERTVLNSPAGQALTEELLKMKLAQNPNMTAEEDWAATSGTPCRKPRKSPRNAKKPAEGNYTPCGLPCVLALSMARPAGFYSLAPSCVPSWVVWPPSTITTSTPVAAASAVAASTVPTFSPASS